MSLIRELLLDKKIMDDKEEIDALLESKGVEEGSVVQSLVFDKSEFPTKDNVVDYLDAHFFGSMHIDEEDKAFVVPLFDEIGFIESTIKRIEIREGLIGIIGILKPMSPDNPIMFSEDEDHNINFISTNLESDKENLKFSESLPIVIEIANVVSGFHPNFGKVEITKADLISFKDNFDNKVTGIDISIDFDHETREAAGWIKELFLSNTGETLLAAVRWTPKGALSLNDREFRYFSPEFNRNFVHQHTGKAHGPTLLGGALVNRPFLKMDAIVSLTENKKGVPKMETILLSDHKATVAGLEKDIATYKLNESTVNTTIEGMKNENTQLSEKVDKLEAAATKKERDDKYSLLFSEGKINAAQLEALKAGKEMIDILSLSAQMNTTPRGSQDGTEAIVLSEQEKKMCKSLGLTDEDFVKYSNGGE